MQNWQNIRNSLRLLALLTVVITIGGILLSYYGLRQTLVRDGRRRAEDRVLAVERRVNEGVRQHFRTAEAIAGDLEIRKAVAGDRKSLGTAREHLLLYRRSFNFISCTILDREGNLITSTDPSGAGWEGAAPRPSPSGYRRALDGEASVQMVFDDASRRRLVFSQPVYERGPVPTGVVFIEIPAEYFEQVLADADGGILLLSDDDGSVFLSSRPSLLDRLLWTKPAGPDENISRSAPPDRAPGEGSGLTRLSAAEARHEEGGTFRIHERTPGCCPDWTVTFLHDENAFMAARGAPFFGRAAYAVAGLCLAVILAAWAFYGAAERNVSRRESAERLLTESEGRSRALARAAKEAIFILKEDDTVLYCNEAAAALFGLPREEIEGHPVTRFVAGEELEKCRAALGGQSGGDGCCHPMEAWGLREGESPFPVEMSVALPGSDGRDYGTVVLRDIGERKAAEAALQETRDDLERKVAEDATALADANYRLMEMEGSRDMLLAGMGRELRGPLDAIAGPADIILQGIGGKLPAEQERQLRAVSRNAHRLLAIVNDIIDVGRMESGMTSPAMERFNAADLIGEVLLSFADDAAEKRIAVSTDIDGALCLSSDRERVRQVLAHLVGNALRFTTGGGAVTVGGSGGNGLVRLFVRDTGIGIRDEDREVLFQPFGPGDGEGDESREGSGVGLYASGRIAKFLGGSLDVDSTYGMGSEFTLTLPDEAGVSGA